MITWLNTLPFWSYLLPLAVICLLGGQFFVRILRGSLDRWEKVAALIMLVGIIVLAFVILNCLRGL